MEEALKKLVERRHPLYEAKLPHWNFLEATYDGGRDWFEGNVFRYVKEGDTEYAERVKRAYRFNHTREVVDLVGKYLFKMDIARKVDNASPAVLAFWKRATRNGLDIDAYVRRIERMASIFGRVWVVVDNTLRTTAEGATPVVTKADETAGAVQIYSYLVRPQQMLDLSYDEAGKLNWVLIHEIKRDDEDPMTSTGALLDRFRLWTRTDWKLFEKRKVGRKTTIELIDSGNHRLGQVPVFPADSVVSDEEYAVASLVEDVAYLDRAVANYLSNLDAIIQDQTFSQLAMPAQGILPGEDGHAKLIDMGTKRIFTFDGEAGQVPFYLTPDVKQAELILKAVMKIINEIYHSVGLSGERTKDDNGGGADNSSGVAKGYDFERTNSLLASKADSMERTEVHLADLVMAWHGEPANDPASPLVTYPSNFDTRGLYDEFEIGARLTLLNAPDGVRREQMRALVKKLFPALSDEDHAKLESELKSWPPEELTALGGNTSGGGPVAAAGAQKTAKELAA